LSFNINFYETSGNVIKIPPEA